MMHLDVSCPNISFPTFSVRPLLVSALLAFLTVTASCDSVGSSDGPSWTGNWTISAVGGTQPDADLDYRVTDEDFDVVVFTGESCEITEGTISETDGNLLTVSFPSTESRVRAEADDGGTSGTANDDEVTFTVVEGYVPGGPGAPRAAEGATVEGAGLVTDPRDKCP